MFVRLHCGENSTRQVAGLKSGRLERGLKAGGGVQRGRKPPLTGVWGCPPVEIPLLPRTGEGDQGDEGRTRLTCMAFHTRS